MTHPLVKGFTSACKPIDRRPPWKWCEDNVVVDDTSPMPGRWRSDWSPWVRSVMEDFADNSVREIVVQCAAQSSKTQTVIACACWSISEDPGPSLWVGATRDELRDFIRDRLQPTFENCVPVKRRMEEPTLRGFSFDGVPFYFAWSGSKARLQSKPIRWLFCDEVRNYPPGRLEMVLKRTRAFWNSRRFLLSTPGSKNDAMDTAFRSGDQRRWSFDCPACGRSQQLRFAQIRWDKNEKTYPEERWSYDALAETIRYECEACAHRIEDNPASRRWIVTHGRFVPTNAHAPRARRSYSWSALLPPWVEWRSIVEEFLDATEAARGGDVEPMYAFITETLGEPWEDRLGEVEDYEFLKARRETYDFGETWSEEVARFMAADRQSSGGEHYWFVVRAFGHFGKSRLIAYGRCSSLKELEIMREQFGVKKANAVIDTGHKAAETYRFCISTGWKAFKGDDAEFYLVSNPATRKVERRIWKKSLVDPSIGTDGTGKRTLPLFRFSSAGAKDLLAEYERGLIGQWTLPRSVGKDYLRQVSAERRVETVNSHGRVKFEWKQRLKDNHLGDCELMLIIVACVTGFAKGSLQAMRPDLTIGKTTEESSRASDLLNDS